jgi:hypothetical protein
MGNDDPFFGLEDTRTEEQKKQDQKNWNMLVTKTIRLTKIEDLFPELFNEHTDGQYNWKTKR